MVLQHLDIR